MKLHSERSIRQSNYELGYKAGVKSVIAERDAALAEVAEYKEVSKILDDELFAALDRVTTLREALDSTLSQVRANPHYRNYPLEVTIRKALAATAPEESPDVVK